jgi:outer membrane lipoprotein-sorting protein
MRPADDIKRFIDKAAVSTNPKADKAVLRLLLTAHQETTVKTPAGAWPDIRNIVMRSPMMKLGIAAGVIAVAGIGMIEFVSSGHKSGVAWAEVLEKTEQTSAVAFDRTIEVNEPAGKLVLRSKVYMARDYGERSDTFMDGKLTEIDYRLPRKNVVYRILVDRKQYWRRDVSYDQAALDREPDDPRTWLKRLLSGDYVKLGRTAIDGVVVEGIEGRMLESGGETVMRFWVDVETNLPVRIEITGIEGGGMMKLVMENFDWSVQLDESFFEPSIPPDYTPEEDPRAAQSRQENVEPRALTEQERAAQPQVKETVTLFLQACSERNWDQTLKYAPDLATLPAEAREAITTYMGGLTIIEVGEPFKTDQSGVWRVPCQIKWKGGGTGGKQIRVRYDETVGRFVVSGGI